MSDEQRSDEQRSDEQRSEQVSDEQMIYADLHMHSKEFIGPRKGAYFNHDIDPRGSQALMQIFKQMENHSDPDMTRKIGSDGTKTTIEILQAAKDMGLGAISIVDHWNLKTIPHTMIWALENPDKAPLYLSGMECEPDFFDMEHTKPMPDGAEVIGYYINPDNKRLSDFVTHRMYANLRRKATWVKSLQKSMPDFDIPSFGRCLNERNFERNPLANKKALYEYILTKNPGKDINYKGFSKFIKEVDAEMENMPKFSLQEFSALVENAGGIVSAAHPGRWESLGLLEEAIENDFVQMVEGKYNYGPYLKRNPNKHEQVRRNVEQLARIVNKYQIPISGGSDDHDGTLLGTEGIRKEEMNRIARLALERHDLQGLLIEGRQNESLSKITRRLLLQRVTRGVPEYLVVQKKKTYYAGSWTFPERHGEETRNMPITPEEKLMFTVNKYLGIDLEPAGLKKIPDYAPESLGPIIYFNVPYFYQADRSLDARKLENGHFRSADWMTLKELRALSNLHPESIPVLDIIVNLEKRMYKL